MTIFIDIFINVCTCLCRWSPRDGVIAELLSMSFGGTHVNNNMKGTVPLLLPPCGKSLHLFYLCQRFENAV